MAPMPWERAYDPSTAAATTPSLAPSPPTAATPATPARTTAASSAAHSAPLQQSSAQQSRPLPSSSSTAADDAASASASAATTSSAASAQLGLDGGLGDHRYGGGGYGSYGSYGGMHNRYGMGGYPGAYGGRYGGGMFGGGMYGGGMYGGGMYGGGPFGMFGPQDPDKDPMPPALRNLENLMYSFGRITQMLEMNFEVLQHFLTSMVGLLERMRAIYQDACHLSSTVTRQSLEFGQTSLSTVREARTRFRRHPITSLTLISIALTLLLRFSRHLRHSFATRPRRRLDAAFASTALDAAWR